MYNRHLHVTTTPYVPVTQMSSVNFCEKTTSVEDQLLRKKKKQPLCVCVC